MGQRFDRSERMKTICILNCHYDNFVAHPGWWAVMMDPEIKKDEVFSFEVDGKLIEFVCDRILSPGHDRKNLEANDSAALAFRDWFIILYVKTENETFEGKSDVSDVEAEADT